MKKRKLILDARMINSSGIGVYLKNIIPKIIEDFEVVLLGDKKELELFSWYNKVKVLNFSFGMYSLKAQLLFPFYVPKGEIFWSPHFNVPLLPIRVKKRIVTIHDVYHLANIESISYLKGLYAKLLYRGAVKKSKAIITVSNFSKSEIVKYTNADKKKIYKIYCGVNDSFFFKKKVESLELLPDNYFLFVGNVKPHKNLILLLRAYKLLPKHIRNQNKLVVLGKKDGFITPDNQIFQFIKENEIENDVVFTGYVEDDLVPRVYAQALVFVFPSLYEGFGLPLLEAMATKIPIISSTSASLKEVGGDAVLYFDPNNPRDLSDKMKDMILDENLRNKFKTLGEKRVRGFSWDTSVEEHKKILNNL